MKNVAMQTDRNRMKFSAGMPFLVGNSSVQTGRDGPTGMIHGRFIQVRFRMIGASEIAVETAPTGRRNQIAATMPCGRIPFSAIFGMFS
jgi:hypothetical protein